VNAEVARRLALEAPPWPVRGPAAASSTDRRYHSRVPVLRPFRALRYSVAASDLPAVLAPPYDVIGPAQRLVLLERHPHNAVRIDLPADLGGADTRIYLTAAETVADWRRSGVLVKDLEPTVTVHQMRAGRRTGRPHRPAGPAEAGPSAPAPGCCPERTIAAKQDRYRLGGDADEHSPSSSRLQRRPGRQFLVGTRSGCLTAAER
jgi:hypothetical protein